MARLHQAPTWCPQSIFCQVTRPEAGPDVGLPGFFQKGFGILSREAVLTSEASHASKLWYLTATQGCSSKGTLQ